MIGANLKEIAKPAKREYGAPKLKAQGLSLREAERIRGRA